MTIEEHQAFEALKATLSDTLRALEAHLDGDILHAGLKHRDALCPCNSNEVRRAKAALAMAAKLNQFDDTHNGGIRPCIQRFAELMELRLRRHDDGRGERGWIGDEQTALLERLDDERKELAEAITECNRAALEAADVANFAMMIADVEGALDAPRGRYEESR